MRAIAVGLLLTAFLAACFPPAGRPFHTTLSTPDGSNPLPVALGDETDLVIGIEPAEPATSASLEPLVQADPTDPSAVIVSWVGGMCDNDASLSLRPSGAGYALHLEVHQKLGLGCPAAGVLRGLRINTSRPIPLGSITTSGRG